MRRIQTEQVISEMATDIMSVRLEQVYEYLDDIKNEYDKTLRMIGKPEDPMMRKELEDRKEGIQLKMRALVEKIEKDFKV